MRSHETVCTLRPDLIVSIPSTVIPPEFLSLILSSLTNGGRKPLRLTCKSVRADHPVMSLTRVSLRQSLDIEVFHAIADHPRFWQQVIGPDSMDPSIRLKNVFLLDTCQPFATSISGVSMPPNQTFFIS